MRIIIAAAWQQRVIVKETFHCLRAQKKKEKRNAQNAGTGLWCSPASPPGIAIVVK